MGRNVLQAGVVHGDVYFDSSSKPVIPRQLLPPDEHFIGRRRELDQLDGAIQHRSGTSPVVVVLRGPGGVGKTALAVQWLSGITDRFPDGQMYAELDLAGNPVAPEDLLGQFLRALGVDPQRIPAGLAERAALFRSVTVTRSVAMLLDNAVSTAQVRVLLPASANSLVVVTSRRSLVGLLARGAQVMHVEPLDSASALKLLADRVGAARIDAEHEQAMVLVNLCGGLPIALCVAAALTMTRPHRSLARMAKELFEERRRLEVLSMDEDMSVRATFDVSYSDLPDPAAAAYRALGLCPGTGFSMELVAVATGTDLAGARRRLDQLVDASLLDEVGEDRYRFHDLIRVHARERAMAETHAARAAVVHRVLEWYLLVTQAAARSVMPARRTLPYEFDRTAAMVTPAGLDTYDAAMDWLEQERQDLLAAVRLAFESGWHRLTHRLADAMQPLLLVHQHPRDAAEVDDIGLRAALAMDDPAAENSMRKRLARALMRLDEFDRAEQQVAAMAERSRLHGDRRAEAHAVETRGILLAQTNRLDLAAAAFRTALVIMTELGRRRSQALLLIYLGEALAGLEELAEAATHLERARAILSTLDPPDAYNATRAAILHGQVQVRLGSVESARADLLEALATATELRSAAEQARAHRALAELARRTGDHQSAERHEAAAAGLAGAASSTPDH